MRNLTTCLAASAIALAAAGNSLAEEIEYAYDAAGRLVEARYDNGAAIRYTYDANGNLLRREITAGSAAFEFVLGDRISGALEQAGDEDAFRFHALAGNTISLKVAGQAGLRLRMMSPAGADIPLDGAEKVLRKGYRVKNLVITEAMLDGALAGFLAVEVFGDDGQVTGAYKLTGKEKQAAANKALKVKDARALDDPVPVHEGTLLSGKLGSRKARTALDDVTVQEASGAEVDFPAGTATENPKRGQVKLTAAPLGDAGVVRVQTAVDTTAALKFKFAHKRRKLTAPDG